jgi:hypothetical protein
MLVVLQRPPALPPDHKTTLEDWLRAQRALLDGEKRLADVAEACAKGNATPEELDQEHQNVKALRALNEAVFNKMMKDLDKPTP